MAVKGDIISQYYGKYGDAWARTQPQSPSQSSSRLPSSNLSQAYLSSQLHQQCASLLIADIRNNLMLIGDLLEDGNAHRGDIWKTLNGFKKLKNIYRLMRIVKKLVIGEDSATAFPFPYSQHQLPLYKIGSPTTPTNFKHKTDPSESEQLLEQPQQSPRLQQRKNRRIEKCVTQCREEAKKGRKQDQSEQEDAWDSIFKEETTKRVPKLEFAQQYEFQIANHSYPEPDHRLLKKYKSLLKQTLTSISLTHKLVTGFEQSLPPLATQIPNSITQISESFNKYYSQSKHTFNLTLFRSIQTQVAVCLRELQIRCHRISG